MEALTIGSVVLIPFPFSDLTKSKLRPALILANSNHNDWIFCQITSNPYSDPYTIELNEKSFIDNSLGRKSYVRPTKLFTGNTDLVIKKVGTLNYETLTKIFSTLISIFEKELKKYHEIIKN